MPSSSPSLPSSVSGVAASAPPHLVIAFAAGTGDEGIATLRALPAPGLRHLGALLQGMDRIATDDGILESLTPPHERVLARAAGLAPALGTPLADGLVPWAALAARQQFGPQADTRAWAWLTPCHWSMGRDHATLADPAALRVSEAESATLRADMQPYFTTDGITLHATAAEKGPGYVQWLAEGELFRHLPTASLDRVLGRNIDPWLPSGAGQGASMPAGQWQRLQNEMQMLLYIHALNDARAAQRQWSINSVWLSGTGALGAGSVPALPAGITLDRSLAAFAFRDDAAGWARAWAALDAGPLAALCARQEAGEAVRLSLCGEHHAHTFETAQRGVLARLAAHFAKVQPLAVLEQL